MIVAPAETGAATGFRYGVAPRIVAPPASAGATELVPSHAGKYWRLTSMQGWRKLPRMGNTV